MTTILRLITVDNFVPGNLYFSSDQNIDEVLSSRLSASVQELSKSLGRPDIKNTKTVSKTLNKGHYSTLVQLSVLAPFDSE